jgi:hypothetical protein
MNVPQALIPRSRRTREAVQRLVSEFHASGLPASEFCPRHGLASSTLRRHLKHAPRDGAAAQPGVRFVAVRVNGAAPAGLEVVLASGRRIAVAPGFDVATLARLVHALEGR